MTAPGPFTLPRSVTGAIVGPITHAIDARWLMAYAAGLGETDSRYFDTQAPGGPAAHPIFPVCYEWPALLALRDRITPEGLATRSVHATHDVILHRPPKAGDTLSTTGRVTGLAHRRAGTLMTVRLETVDAEGQPVTTSDYGSIYRGVGFEGGDAGLANDAGGGAAMPAGAAESSVAVPIGLAHIYTECARIWNPIHTDIAIARAAGLPDIILHGTATLALAVSQVLSHAGLDPRAPRRVTARFTGMVMLPSSLTVRVAEPSAGRVLLFEAGDGHGATVLSGGSLHLP